MPPIMLHSSWNQRSVDLKERIEPLRKYFFICEGANTETFYFKELIRLKKKIGIHPLIDLVFLEKTDEDKYLSYPEKLVKFARKQMKELIASDVFDETRDKMIVMFDTDIFNKRTGKDKFWEILKEEDQNITLGLTYPSFELFLLLHIENSVNDVIIPNEDEILQNDKVGNQRPCYRYLLEYTDINCKKNSAIGTLAEKIDVAIEQEKLINQDPKHCLTDVTSNIAALIEKIKEERLPF